MSQTFLVTGASSGLGLALALVILQQGHKVIATARNVSKASKDHPEVEQKGGKWLELDVDKTNTESVVQKVVEENHVDVLINNAGYAIIGSIEDVPDSETQEQFNTNVFGALRTIRGALPYFRSKKSGVIVNIGSIAGLDGLPGSGIYAATKHAMEGFTEALSIEIAQFNIPVLMIEPGALRTNFQTAIIQPKSGISSAYEKSPSTDLYHKLKAMAGNQKGDPTKCAERILDAVKNAQTQMSQNPGKPCLTRLLLGKDAITRARDKFKTKSAEAEKNASISESVDVDE